MTYQVLLVTLNDTDETSGLAIGWGPFPFAWYCVYANMKLLHSIRVLAASSLSWHARSSGIQGSAIARDYGVSRVQCKSSGECRSQAYPGTRTNCISTAGDDGRGPGWNGRRGRRVIKAVSLPAEGFSDLLSLSLYPIFNPTSSTRPSFSILLHPSITNTITMLPAGILAALGLAQLALAIPAPSNSAKSTADTHRPQAVPSPRRDNCPTRRRQLPRCSVLHRVRPN